MSNQPAYPEESPDTDLEIVPSVATMPEQAVAGMQQFVGASVQMMGGMVNPLQDKIESEHITAALNLAAAQSDREHKDRNWHRLFIIALVVIAFAFVIGMVILDSKDLVGEFLPWVVGGGAGAAGGYGIGISRRR